MHTAVGATAALEDFVEAFEKAQAQGGPLELADFLPARPHPLYREVLSELIRIDLEYSWRRGRPKRVEDYRPLYPPLFEDAGVLEGVLFEEYRLRRQAGEQPSRAEYRRRLGSAGPY